MTIFVTMTACVVQGNAEVDSSTVEAKKATKASNLTDPLDLLINLKPWCGEDAYEKEDIEILKTIGLDMMNYDLDTIRSALKSAEDLRYNRDPVSSSKIFVLMRVLFEVPDSVEVSKIDRRIVSSSGFFRPQRYNKDNTLYWAGWPLVWDNNGELVSVFACTGMKYSDVLYHFVDEFDAMRSQFPRRVWK